MEMRWNMAFRKILGWPRNIMVGAGALKDLGSTIKDMGKGRVILITDNGLKDLPIIGDTVDMLKNDGLEVSLFSDVGPNPTVAMIESAVAVMKDVKPDIIVSIGGGSPIDTGKVANVVYTHGGSAIEYDSLKGGLAKIKPILLPLIAVPTTAGTGAEVTFVGVITNSETHVKFGVGSPLLMPDIALLDPEATVSLPPKITAYTGLDTLTHAIEAYVSAGAVAFGDAFAMQVIKIVSRTLKTAVEKGDDIQAREKMIMASAMGGMAFIFSGLGVCHGMSHPLSAHFGIPHGLAYAMMLKKSMEYNIDANLQRFAEIAQAMGADINGLSLEDAAQKSIDVVGDLLSDLEIPIYLDDVGAMKDKVPELAVDALGDNVMRNNPRKATLEEIEALYLTSFRP